MGWKSVCIALPDRRTFPKGEVSACPAARHQHFRDAIFAKPSVEQESCCLTGGHNDDKPTEAST